MGSKATALDITLGIATAILIVALAFVIVVGGAAPVAPKEIPDLGSWFLQLTFNVDRKDLWSASPEVVTSILWDYRGLDTVYETAVFFLAIISALALLRDVKKVPGGYVREVHGLTVIAKTITNITFAAILVVSASIAFHGHLTPGGGFQGGAALAVAPLLMIAAYSYRILVDRGWTKSRLLGVRTLGLISIVSIALAGAVALIVTGEAAYVMQNQWKPWAPGIGWPYEVNLLGRRTLVSGTLFFLNISEYLAVGAGFTLVFLLMSIPSKEFFEGGGKRE